MCFGLGIFNRMCVSNFSYDIDDDYTALYKGMVFFKLSFTQQFYVV